jgi:hypothetical protein
MAMVKVKNEFYQVADEAVRVGLLNQAEVGALSRLKVPPKRESWDYRSEELCFKLWDKMYPQILANVGKGWDPGAVWWGLYCRIEGNVKEFEKRPQQLALF